MEIKNIEKSYINAVVEVHKNSFNDFFLTRLGDDFLKVYYESLRNNNNALLIGLFSGGKLCGFCAASVLSKGFNTQLIKNNFLQFSLIGIRLLFTRPYSFVRLIKNFSKINSNIEDNAEYAELVSIGVSKNDQGKGIGKKLLFELEKELKLKGCSKLSLTTDYYSNENTIGFYKRSGN